MRQRFNPWVGKIPWRRCLLAWRIPWTEEPGGLQSEGVTRVGHGLAIKQQLWVARTQMPNSVPAVTAGLSGWYVSEQSRCIPELLFWQVSGCACVSDSPICSLGFRVAPVLETRGLCVIAPLAGEQPRDCSHPVACVSPSILVTKWEEALVITLVAVMRFRGMVVIYYLHPSTPAVDVTLPSSL